MLDDVLAAYDRAWNEPDRAARTQLPTLSLTEDAELGDPLADRVAPLERGEDNRLRRVVMFFGPLPQAGQ